jgi:hypothetical protein
MHMFVANASLQKFQFHYRLPEQTKQRTLEIEPLSQTAIPDELQPADVDSVLAQHEPYGMVSVEAVKGGVRLKSRSVLLYSTEGPVPAPLIRTLYDLNRGLLDEFGRNIRREAAIATNNVLQNTLDTQRSMGLDAQVAEVEMTVQEEEPSNGFGDKKPIGEGFVVTEQGEDNKPTTSKRRGR